MSRRVAREVVLQSLFQIDFTACEAEQALNSSLAEHDEFIYLEEESILTDDDFYKDGRLRPECKIIRTKFENGLPVIPPEGESEAESP